MFAYDPDLGQKPVPNQIAYRTLTEDPPYVASNNADGLRKNQVSTFKKSPKTEHILVLGDSFTYGTGVNDHETFSSLLEEKLRARGRDIIVHNAGNPGTGTDYALKFLMTKGAKYTPRKIIVNFFPNDFADNDGARYFLIYPDRLQPIDTKKSFSFYLKKQGLSNSKIYQWLCEHSHALSFFRRAGAWIKVSGGLGDLKTFLRNRPDYQSFERGMAAPRSIAVTKRLFLEIKKEAKNLHSRLLVTYSPSYVDMRTYLATGRPSRDEAAFRRLIEDLKIDWVSFTPALAKSKAALSQLYLKEGHWAPLSHAVAADILVEKYP